MRFIRQVLLLAIVVVVGGIRLALGASRFSIVGTMLRDGLTPTLAGVLIGLVCEFGLLRFVASFVPKVQAADMPTSVLVVVILTCTALAACLIPAWRASQLNPIETLRHE